MAISRKTIKWSLILIIVVWIVLYVTKSCQKSIEPTYIQIEDSIRHYPATILGDDLEMVYVVRNVGDNMLVITDIQPAAPTIEVDKANVDMVPPGKEAYLKFIYHSDKNIGLARHIIRIFGNIHPNGVANIIFDTHVVRPSIDLSDYEEYYHDELKNAGENLLNQRKGAKEYSTEGKTDGTDKIDDKDMYSDFTAE